jgi:hypothetical protein
VVFGGDEGTRARAGDANGWTWLLSVTSGDATGGMRVEVQR